MHCTHARATTLRPAPYIAFFEIGAGLEERLYHLQVAVLARVVQRALEVLYAHAQRTRAQRGTWICIKEGGTSQTTRHKINK